MPTQSLIKKIGLHTVHSFYVVKLFVTIKLKMYIYKETNNLMYKLSRLRVEARRRVIWTGKLISGRMFICLDGSVKLYNDNFI